MILFLCYVFPPAAVFFMGRPFSAVLNVFLTAFGWVPGVQHALVLYADRKSDKVTRKITKAIDHPKWFDIQGQSSAPSKASRSKKKPVEENLIDSPYIGVNGTKFRRRK